jgi:hypothetical protein
MGYTVQTYGLVGSALSDIHEITTTATDLSIKVTHNTYRNITAFADNGDSRTLITSARHCVADTVVGATADTIKIATGSYAGTWTVDEWVSYDQFIINTPYVDNVAVQFYTDSQYYNRPYYGGNTYQGMSVYISNVNPIGSDGLFINSLDYWDRRPWTAPGIDMVLVYFKSSMIMELFMLTYSVVLTFQKYMMKYNYPDSFIIVVGQIVDTIGRISFHCLVRFVQQQVLCLLLVDVK